MDSPVGKNKESFKAFIAPIGIFLLALILRLICLDQLKNCPLFDAPIIDALYNDQWARAIAAGNWIGDMVFYRAPFYPYFLAVIYKLSNLSYYAPRLIQAILGSLSCVLIYFIARKSFNKTVGIIAGFIAVVYGTFIYFEGQLLLDSIAVFLDLVLVSMLIYTQEKPKNWKWFVAGLVLGLSTITRPTILLFGGFIICWLWIILKNGKRFRKWLLASAMICAGVLVFVLPVTIRNYVVSKDFVIIAANGGINLYIGNNPESNGWTAFGPGTQGTCKELKCSEVSNYWFKKSIDFIRNMPLTCFLLLSKKLFLFWEGIEISNNQDVYFFGSGYSPLLRMLLWQKYGLAFPFGIIGPLALLGIALLVRQWRRHLLIYGFIFVQMLSVIVFFVCARYRLPVVAVLIAFSAYTIHWWFQQVSASKFKDLLISLMTFIILVFLVNIDISGVNEANIAQNYFNLGLGYTKKEQWQEALTAYNKAVELDPRYTDPYNNIGNIHYRHGRYDEAIRQYRMAIACDPGYVMAYMNLANSYFQIGVFKQAVKYYEITILIDPEHERAYEYCGLAYARLGRIEEARVKWKKTLELNPGNKTAFDGLRKLGP